MDDWLRSRARLRMNGPAGWCGRRQPAATRTADPVAHVGDSISMRSAAVREAGTAEGERPSNRQVNPAARAVTPSNESLRRTRLRVRHWAW
jgi:hypothetical protein